jgi:AcrR family transcriptional regulator
MNRGAAIDDESRVQMRDESILAEHAGATELASDGRVRRGSHNHALIIEAVISLMRAGTIRPTADQVAQCAGVGARTIFRHFTDMDGLFREVSSQIVLSIAPILLSQPPEGTLERADWLAEIRVETYARIAPFLRAIRLLRDQSDSARARHDSMGISLRRQVECLFANELRALPAGRLDAIDLLVSFEGIERLRELQQLGSEETTEVLRSALRALLQP